MGFGDLFKKSVSKDSFVVTWLDCHKNISRSLFTQFKDIFTYKNEIDMLLAFKEIEYLVFWLLRRHLNESAMFDVYSGFLKESKLSIDSLMEQLEIRYRLYDRALAEFTDEKHRGNPSKQGLKIGQTLINSVGNLDLMKNGVLEDKQHTDMAKTFKAFSIWFEGLKVIDSIVEKSKSKFRIEAFLRKGQLPGT